MSKVSTNLKKQKVTSNYNNKTTRYHDTEHNFKWRHFTGSIILQCLRWYCKYSLSYRDLEELMIERGISVDHSTIYRWVYEYAPDFEKKIRWHQGYRYSSWRVDETYIKVKGKWRYLYRAVDKNGTTIDFFLSHKRDSKSAKRFFKQALRKLKDYERPSIINTDKNPAYNSAIEDLKKEGLLNINTEHRKVKYLNNIVESDHFRLKKAMKVIHGFKTFSSAYRTIKGMEAMLMIKKRQCIIINNTEEHKILEEVNFVNKLFGLYKVEYV